MRLTSKGKMIITILSSAVVLIIVGGIFLNKGIYKKNNTDKEIASNIENVSIENDIPITTIYQSSDIESKNGIEVTDNEEILRRYKNIDKKTLTYEVGVDPGTAYLDDPYFYESEHGLTLNIKENNNLKPINDKKFYKVLLGYSFAQLDEPMTREEALNKALLVLPNDYDEISSKSYDDYELVHYDSEKGAFIVYLGYNRMFNDEQVMTDIDNNKIESISYFKELQN